MDVHQAKIQVRILLDKIGRVSGATPQEVETFEQSTGLQLPPITRELISECSGLFTNYGQLLPLVRPDSSELADIVEVSQFPGFGNLGRIPIADNECGNYFYVCSAVSTQWEPVYYDPEPIAPFLPKYLAASTPWHFAYFFLTSTLGASEGWPFESSYVLDIDPKIGDEPSTPLPWQV